MFRWNQFGFSRDRQTGSEKFRELVFEPRGNLWCEKGKHQDTADDNKARLLLDRSPCRIELWPMLQHNARANEFDSKLIPVLTEYLCEHG